MTKKKDDVNPVKTAKAFREAVREECNIQEVLLIATYSEGRYLLDIDEETGLLVKRLLEEYDRGVAAVGGLVIEANKNRVEREAQLGNQLSKALFFAERTAGEPHIIPTTLVSSPSE